MAEHTNAPTTAAEEAQLLNALVSGSVPHMILRRILFNRDALLTERDAALALLRRAALGEEPQIRAFHDPLCGQCLGCQARALLAQHGKSGAAG